MPDGNTVKLKYDEYARLVEETDPLGRKIKYKYHLSTTLVTETTFLDGSTWKARYDAKGNLIAEVDALGNKTEYLNSDDGLPHTLIDATQKSKYLWWNTLAQVERFQDCSGKNSHYRFDERHHLIAVTDALNQTTTLERKPDGEVLRIQHPDGSAESFTYNALSQVLTHTDGKGQTTRLLRTARGLPSSRQDAKGQRICYEYDQAIRLTAPNGHSATLNSSATPSVDCWPSSTPMRVRITPTTTAFACCPLNAYPLFFRRIFDDKWVPGSGCKIS